MHRKLYIELFEFEILYYIFINTIYTYKLKNTIYKYCFKYNP